MLLLEADRARREAVEAHERGDYGTARAALRRTADVLDVEAGADEDLREELADLRLMERQYAQEVADVLDVKYMKQRMYDSGMSRYRAKERYRRTSPPR